MSTFDYIWKQLLTITPIDILDIVLVSFILFYVYRFIRDRRASKLAIGVALVVAVSMISNLIEMRALSFLLSNIVQVGVILIVIIFQPELRAGLEKLGGGSLKGLKTIAESKDSQSMATTIDNICEAVSEMSHEYTGALIVIEQSTPLGDIIKTGTIIDAAPTVSLIKNIFYNKAPLHDGAMIIKNGRICAAGCFLPMSTNDDIIKDLGTRHRSAIGMSENSDAIIIVVSEETGTVSIASNGQLRRNYDKNTLRNELITLLPRDSHGRRKRSAQ